MRETTELDGVVAPGLADLAGLAAALRGAEQALIVPHTNPDPDAIASAVGLRYLLEVGLGLPATIGYQGVVGRPENRALVRYLGRPLRRLRSPRPPASRAVVVVDTQPGAGNCPLAADVRVRAVFDHHPLQTPLVAAEFQDLRPALGATATIVTAYLQQSGLPLPPPIATALFYGIKTDTWGLVRGATAADVAAYLFLQPRIDATSLLEIEQAQVPVGYFRQLYVAVQRAWIYGDVLIASVGPMAYPDLAGELADMMLRLEGIQWSACLGGYEDQLILSLRTRRKRGGAGRVAQAVVGAAGTAGGHGMSAGGQIALGGQALPVVTAVMWQRLLRQLQKTEAEGQPLVAAAPEIGAGPG